MPGVPASATQSVSILTAMITPTILILAAASLVGATTTRQQSIMAAMHELAEAFDTHMEYEQEKRALNSEQISLMLQVQRSSKRARLMQYTIAMLHAAILSFVLAQLTLALEAVAPIQLGLTPVGFATPAASCCSRRSSRSCATRSSRSRRRARKQCSHCG
jgi:hypothetical protein